MLMRVRYVVVLGCVLCCLGCTPSKKVEEPLVVRTGEVVSAAKESETAFPSSLPVMTLRSCDYPRVIAAQKDMIVETLEPALRRDAYLRLFSLHMGRLNPNQDLFAASAALNLATELDPSLLEQPYIQRWLDVFAELLAMRNTLGDAGQLYKDNKVLREEVQKQQCAISYLESTLDELRKVENDVAKKKRLYR